MTKREAVFSKDLPNKKLTVVRAFDASLEQVWKAWTKSEILDQWWAPKPYKAETKSMDFREGGLWLYAMVSPAGDKHWCRVDYRTIGFHKSITSSAVFCDDQGNINPDFPSMHWKQQFNEAESVTTVRVEINFDKEADMQTIMQMGFQEGFTMGLDNLDGYLSVQKS